jgi:hypothetical protein
MTPLISVIMPTRGPLEGLIKALKSIRDTCSDNSKVEILLRIDDDDSRRIIDIPDLKAGYGVKTVIGPRGAGYMDMGRFADDLLDIAQGKWAWLFDDDSWVIGNTWLEQMERMPMDCAANAQFYQLGPSIYNNGPEGGPVGLFVPMELAKSIKPTPSPVDQTWLDVVLKRGWKVRQLQGITYCHDGRPR